MVGNTTSPPVDGAWTECVFCVYRSAPESSERPVQDCVSSGGGQVRLGVETEETDIRGGWTRPPQTAMGQIMCGGGRQWFIPSIVESVI